MNDLQEYEPQRGGALTDVESNRAAAQVQSQMVIAKKFPRAVTACCNRIVDACKRPRLAEAAIYTYPRGGQKVEGPSIRLAEAIAQNWMNLDYGIVELEQNDGASTVMAYCHDLETNTKRQTTFVVSHERHTRNGVTKLTDPRDIYEMVANQGARRLRACILAVVPGDVVEEALEQCDKTLRGASDIPLSDRIKKMGQVFQSQGVTLGMLEERLGHNLDATSDFELADLRKIYNSIKDGMSKPEDWFGVRVEKGSKVGKSTVMDDLDAETQASDDEPAHAFTLPVDGPNDEPSIDDQYIEWLSQCETVTDVDQLVGRIKADHGSNTAFMRFVVNKADMRKAEIQPKAKKKPSNGKLIDD